MSVGENTTQWQHLSGEAKAGRLMLDPAVATDCIAACDEFIRGLDEIDGLAVRVQRAEGFGGFDSGVALAGMYGRKGIGGPDAIDVIIRQHRQVVELMRDTISASVTRVGEQDDSNSQQISAIEPG